MNAPNWAKRRLAAKLAKERDYNNERRDRPFSCKPPLKIGGHKYRLATRRRDDGEFEALWFRWAPDCRGRQMTVVAVPWTCVPTRICHPRVSREYYTSDGCWWHDGELVRERYQFRDIARPDYEACRKLLDLHLRTKVKSELIRGLLWILNK